jgi:hypothetical protein
MYANKNVLKIFCAYKILLQVKTNQAKTQFFSLIVWKECEIL